MATLFDFYSKQGQSLPSVADRAKTFQSAGLGTSYSGTAEQNAALLNYLQTPKTIDAEKLSQEQTPVVPQMITPTQAVAEATKSVASANPVPDLNTLIQQFQAPSAAEVRSEELQKKLESTLESARGQGQAILSEEARLGVPESVKQLQSLNQQISQLQAGLDLGLAAEESRAIPLQFITGRQAEMRRQAATQIGSLATVAQALQGNIALAKQTAQNTVALKYADIEQDIANTKTLIDLNYNQMSNEQKKKADVLNLQLQRRSEMVAEQKADEEFKNNLAIQYIQNGGSQDGAQKIMNATDRQDAIYQAADFIQTPNTQIIELGGQAWVYDANKQQLVKSLGTTASGSKLEYIEDSFGNKIYGTFDGTNFTPISVPNAATMESTDLSAAINRTINTLGLSNQARKDALSSLQQTLSTGNVDLAKEQLETLIKNNARAGEADKLNGWQQAFDSAERLEKAIKAYQLETGDTTSWWGGMTEKALQKVGQTTDSRLAQLKSEIALSIMSFRSFISGAAFTESEAKAYADVFPDINKTPDLNAGNLAAIKSTMLGNKESFIKNKVGAMNYDIIFGNTKTTPTLSPLTKSYNSLDSLVRENPSYLSVVEEMVKLNPQLSDSDIMRELESMQGNNVVGATALNQNLVSQLSNLNTNQSYQANTLLGNATITGLGGSSKWKQGLDIVFKSAKLVLPFLGVVEKVVNNYTNDTGKPLSSAAGKAQNGGFGNQVAVRLQDGTKLLFSHLANVANLKPGETIYNTYIGTQGNTGTTMGNTGIHTDITGIKPDGTYMTAQEVAALLNSRIS